ncbi:MAG: tRNA lysidine(34) synthetase TilS [Prevotella sp.]|nr:tRNA lysidine(34) synthetase TilS [Prevotella sp.]
MNFQKTVATFIEANDLLSFGKKYIVALSGGADSVALLMLLHALHYDIEAAHCNFHLRGEEANRDETFVRHLCKRIGVTLHTKHFDTTAWATAQKMSIETAARELRYAWFGELLTQRGAEAVCAAHHKDDSAETILMNIIRGTGVNGFLGIKARNHNILRPLLCVGRKDIEEYLEDIGQDYITDSSNMKDDVVRNKMRLNIIPILKEINPKAVENILRTADNIAEAINGTDENRLYGALSGYGFNGSQVRQMATVTESGREFLSPTHRAIIDRSEIIVEPTLQAETIDAKGFEIIRSKDCACLDADLVKMPIKMRTVQEGDSFIPFGMKGRKLLSDFLTDNKMPLNEKRRQQVVVDAEERIVWVVGLRPDDRFRITNSTQRVLFLSRQRH